MTSIDHKHTVGLDVLNCEMKTPFQFGCRAFFYFNGPDSMTPTQFQDQIALGPCRGSVKRSQGIEEEEKKRKRRFLDMIF